jgi:hypothetical protein
MHRFCPHCKEIDGLKAKVVKLKEPVVVLQDIREVLYEMTYTHSCAECGCLFGDGKKKKIEDLK